MEARVGIEPTNAAFAEPCLTTWLHRRCSTHNSQLVAAGKRNFAKLPSQQRQAHWPGLLNCFSSRGAFAVAAGHRSQKVWLMCPFNVRSNATIPSDAAARRAKCVD